MIKLIFIIITYPIILLITLLLSTIFVLKFIFGFKRKVNFVKYLITYGLKYPIRAMRR